MSRPFRALTIAGKPTQGDALGWYALPLQGREVGVDIYFGATVSILRNDPPNFQPSDLVDPCNHT